MAGLVLPLMDHLVKQRVQRFFPAMPAEMPRHPSEASQGYWNRLYTRQSTGFTPPMSPELERYAAREADDQVQEDVK